MRVYYWLYYRLYRLARGVDKSDPTLTALLMLSMLELFNVISAFEWLYGQHHALKIPTIWYVGVPALVLLTNGLIFVPKDRRHRIIDQFKDETKNQRIVGIVVLLLYVLATMYFFVCMPVKR